jgi:hypothetical protein
VPTGEAAALKMRADDRAVTQPIVVVVSTLRTSARPRHACGLAGSFSPPLPIGCAENRDYTERKKDGAKNISIPRPSEDCAKQRQGGEQSKIARLGVHSRS